MPKVSINILTKNRKDSIKKCIDSVLMQSFKDVEIILVNDGSADGTAEEISNIKFQISNKIINHEVSKGITLSRQEALEGSRGEYVAILDDDDEWIDANKLAKQVKYLDEHKEVVLVGGGIRISNIKPARIVSQGGYQISKFRPKTDEQIRSKNYELRMRAESDLQIRNTMLLRNNFFTSTVMFRRQEALGVGGFKKDNIDLAEDYSLWLRLGKVGKMYNFQEPFTLYSKTVYNKEKLLKFYQKQLWLISESRESYSYYTLAYLLLKLRMVYEKIF